MPGTRDWLATEIEARRRPNGTLTLNRRGASAFNDFGHYTEQFGAAHAICELLLQSVNDILRLFPAWPKDRDAKFQNLKAQGGFLVSAEMIGGRITRIEITSTVGGLLKLAAPWAVRLSDGNVGEEGQIISMTTRTNERLVFMPEDALTKSTRQGFA